MVSAGLIPRTTHLCGTVTELIHMAPFKSAIYRRKTEALDMGITPAASDLALCVCYMFIIYAVYVGCEFCV